jgi:hypothetical protein
MKRSVLLQTCLGVTSPAKVGEQDGQAGTLKMDPEFNMGVGVEVLARNSTGFVIE